MKKIFFNIIFSMIFMAPILTSGDGFVPCTDNCGYKDLIIMINNIIDWVVKISIPLAAVIFAYAGFLYMLTGIKDEKARARIIFKNVLIGFIFILSAWIIVTTITNNLLSSDFKGAIPIEGVK